MANKEIYRAFTDTLETKARGDAASREPSIGSFAFMFGYTLGTIPHLLDNLKLTADQEKILEEYFVNYP
jgi:hypothetical protein